MKTIYTIPPTPIEEHHKAINDIHTIIEVMQTQSYNLYVLAQSNAVLTRSKSAVMAQLAHMNVTMNAI